jgi:TIR domain
LSKYASAAFVSYSHDDSEFTIRLVQDLKAAGAGVWLDQLDIEPGQEWDTAIENALKQSPRTLLVLSPSSVKSRNVLNEINFALEEKKVIIPVLHRDCIIPLQLRRIQYIDFRTDYAFGLKALLKNLNAQGSEQGVPPSSKASRESSLSQPEEDDRKNQPKHEQENGRKISKSEETGLRKGSQRKTREASEGVETAVMNGVDSPQPLSAKNYVIIAALGFIFAAGFTLFYVYRVPQLVESGVQGQVFYLLLIPWALACAAFLFGAMKSYARFTHKHLGNFLELGGPVVLFCLVLLGGFKLVPPAPETFDLAVRAHSEDVPLITSGQITLDLPGLPHANIGPDGEANFKGVSARFKGTPIRVLPHVDGYEEKWQTPKLKDNVLDLNLERAHPVIVLSGLLVPPPGKGKSIKVLVDGQDGETSPDDLGRFKLNVNGKAGDRVRVKVYDDRKLVYDDYQVLPGPVTLTLQNRRLSQSE